MRVESYTEIDNYIELIIFDGINSHTHLLNKEYKNDIDVDYISIAKYSEIVENCILEAIYYRCINRISYRKRSINYIRKYLDNELPIKIYTEYIINKLKHTKYLDDSDYARAYIKDMIHLNRYGPVRIHSTLEKDNILKSIIDEEIKLYSEDLILKNIEFYISNYLKNNKDSYMMFKNKSINKLINKGYNIDDISKYFENNNIVIYEEILIKNYLYDNNVDVAKLKDRLIKRGFNSDKVVKVIEENKEKKTFL